jgi:hypothetical protein
MGMNMPANDEYTRNMIITYLEQFDYWLSRFEESRDVEHFDNAERNAEVVRLYLPIILQELNFTGFRNVYWSLSAKQASSKNKDTPR